jgi:TM2 domain-containing membrane protein YozV
VSQEWYYSIDGDRQGPVGSADLKKLAEAGTLKPGDLVWKDGMGDWAQAKSIKGLFGGGAPKTGEQPVAQKPKPAAAEEERPSARGKPRDDDDDDRPRRRRDEDDDEDRPSRGRVDDEDEDRPRSRRRDADDEDEDRPVRRRDEDDDDDRPQRKKRRVPEEAGSKKMTTAIVALIMGVLGFGWIGIHKFMLGQTKVGLIYLLGSVLTCGLGAIVFNVFAIIDGIIYLTKSDEDFYQTYIVEQKEWF